MVRQVLDALAAGFVFSCSISSFSGVSVTIAHRRFFRPLLVAFLTNRGSGRISLGETAVEQPGTGAEISVVSVVGCEIGRSETSAAAKRRGGRAQGSRQTDSANCPVHLSCDVCRRTGAGRLPGARRTGPATGQGA